MLVELIRDSVGPNPEFDPTKPRSVSNMKTRCLPKGTQIEGPDAWMLCLDSRVPKVDKGFDNHPAKAKPIDQEAIDRVTYEKNRISQSRKQISTGKVTLPQNIKTKK